MLSPEQIEAFHRKGVLVIPDFFEQDLIAGWQSCWKRFRTSLVDKSSNRIDRFVYGLLPDPIGKIYTNERLVGCMKQLLGPDLALYLVVFINLCHFLKLSQTGDDYDPAQYPIRPPESP